MAESLSSKVRKAQGRAGNDTVQLAAAKYVQSGMKDLGLTSKQKYDLSQKLTPIVARVISAERGRTATRAEGIQNRETKKTQETAKKKILGGK